MHRFPSFSRVELSRPTPDQIIKDCLNGAANHEAKSLTAIYYSTQPNMALGGTAVAEAINEAQGSDVAWAISPASVNHYCEKDLGPIANIISREKGDLWRANPEYAAAKLALVVLVGLLSLDYPDMSVQRILGSTRQVGGKYVPEFRFGLYEAMLRSPDELSIEALAAQFPNERPGRFVSQIIQLGRLGIIQKKTSRGMNPDIRIVDNRFWHLSMTADQLIPESRALYAALKKLTVDSVLTLDDLVDAAIAEDGSINNIALRNAIMKDKSYFPGLELESRPMKKNKLSTVEITPAALGFVRALCQGAKDIRDGVGIEDYTKRANELIDNQASCRTLMEKARNFSPAANKVSNQEVADTILAVLQRKGSCSLDELHAEMDTLIVHSSLRRHVNRLIDDSRVKFEVTSKGPHTKKILRKYSLND